jgi:glutathione synthase/RimK-type ligase-like ATP-grasp enzyme
VPQNYQKSILIVTTQDDLHSNAVARSIESLGGRPVLLEREAYGSEWALTASQGSEGVGVSFDMPDATLRMQDIGAIWLRRDFTIETTKKDSSPEALYVATQTVIHVNGVIALLAERVPCMNRPEANRRCNSKFYQAEIARQHGLMIPETFQGGHPSAAYRFQERIPEDRRICIKPLEAVHLRKSDGTIFAHYNSIFQRRPEAQLTSLRDCPVILQEFVEKEVEIRATVVGDQVFAASIDTRSASEQAQIDWRHYDWANTPYRQYELPVSVRESLLKIMRALGLSYGAFDLIKSKNGEFFFLEVNSQGQWLWVEDLTDLKITDGVAQWLITAAQQSTC